MKNSTIITVDTLSADIGKAKRQQGMKMYNHVGGQILSGIVKWYSYKKGYGFIASPSLERDVLIHFSVLDSAHIRNLRPGDKLNFEAHETPHGMQVKSITAFEESFSSQHDAQSFKLTGKLKWFNRVKGFGFIVPFNETEEVFVHATTLQKSDLLNIMPGTTLEVDTIRGDKGLEATHLQLIKD